MIRWQSTISMAVTRIASNCGSIDPQLFYPSHRSRRRKKCLQQKLRCTQRYGMRSKLQMFWWKERKRRFIFVWTWKLPINIVTWNALSFEAFASCVNKNATHVFRLKIRERVASQNTIQTRTKFVREENSYDSCPQSLLLQARRDTTQDTCPHPMKGLHNVLVIKIVQEF